jgi:hypothetical protein
VHFAAIFWWWIPQNFREKFVACIGSDVLTKNLENVGF